jgi:hypothetical protein
MDRPVTVSAVYLAFSPGRVDWLARVDLRLGSAALAIYIVRDVNGALALRPAGDAPEGLTDAERAAIRDAALSAYREKVAPPPAPPRPDAAPDYWAGRHGDRLRRLYGGGA